MAHAARRIQRGRSVAAQGDRAPHRAQSKSRRRTAVLSAWADASLHAIDPRKATTPSPKQPGTRRGKPRRIMRWRRRMQRPVAGKLALQHTRRSLLCDAENLNARNLAVLALRALHRERRSRRHAGRHSRHGSARPLEPPPGVGRRARGQSTLLLDLVWDYAYCGQHETAVALLQAADLSAKDGSAPLVLYTLGYLLHRMGRSEEGDQAWQSAAAAPPDYCFPHRLEEMLVLQAVIDAAPAGCARAVLSRQPALRSPAI